jgi:hypothetical protein
MQPQEVMTFTLEASMALVLTLAVGDMVDIADRSITVLAIDSKKTATLITRDGEKIPVSSTIFRGARKSFKILNKMKLKTIVSWQYYFQYSSKKLRSQKLNTTESVPIMSLTSDQFSSEIGSSCFKDRWIALSSLQKSIRRGAIEPAMAAAEVLWTEPSRLLDRLLVISLEDIGVGDPEVLREAIELTTERTWRRKLPDKGREATIGLVERMCTAAKSRFADEILAIAQLELALGPARTELAIATTEQLADCIATSDDIVLRALASWFLAGTARYPMDGILRRQGDLAAVWETARELGVPADWLNLLDRAARRMHWPLAVLLPLAYVSKVSGTPTQLVKDTPYETWRGVPLYALDQFTRRGLVAIGRWLAGCPELQEILRAAAPRSAWPKISRYAVFAVEGQVCGRHLMWSEQRGILCRSMQAELTGRGLIPEHMDALLNCAETNLPALNEMRREVMDEIP